MRRKSKWFIALMVLIMALSMTACGGSDSEPSEEPASWADQYVALIDSGEGRDYADYESIKAELDTIREDIGATYVYVLTPMTDDEIAFDGNPDEGFAITVDGSEEPDDWGVVYDWEVQFKEAWEGEAAAARSAWNDSDTEQCWSAFAPVYDSEGNVVCILGIDYPCTDVTAEYPEWNRDNEAWNGFEDEITGEVPEAVQAKIDEVKAYASDYAKQLSGN